MDLSNERFRKILLISFVVLIALLILINIVKYINSLPGYEATVYPTPISDSSTQRENPFVTLKPEEVNSELQDILNKRPTLTQEEHDSIASVSANLILHPYRGSDFDISYSPLLNLFFIHKKVSNDQADAAILDFLGDPVLKDMYKKNGGYRLFVFSGGSAEYAKFTFERQYYEINSKLPPNKRLK